jgi:hypothetical protein
MHIHLLLIHNSHFIMVGLQKYILIRDAPERASQMTLSRRHDRDARSVCLHSSCEHVSTVCFSLSAHIAKGGGWLPQPPWHNATVGGIAARHEGPTNGQETVASLLTPTKESRHQMEPGGHGDATNDRQEEPKAVTAPRSGHENKGGRGGRGGERRAPCHHHPSGLPVSSNPCIAFESVICFCLLSTQFSL